MPFTPVLRSRCPGAPDLDADRPLWESSGNPTLLVANCYAFALNRWQRHAIEPGHLGLLANSAAAVSGPALSLCDPGSMRRRLEQDGLTPIGPKERPSATGWAAVLYLGGERYHFARATSDGGWAHKPGQMAPQRLLLPWPGLRLSEIGMLRLDSWWWVEPSEVPDPGGYFGSEAPTP